MPQNPSVGHRILLCRPYLALVILVVHPCAITINFAILLARGMCDDLKFAMSGQRPGKIFNNCVRHCTTQLVLFCRRLEIKWDTFFYIETTKHFNKRFVLKIFASCQKFQDPPVTNHTGLEPSTFTVIVCFCVIAIMLYQVCLRKVFMGSLFYII